MHRILLAACVTDGDAPGVLAVAERLFGLGAGPRSGQSCTGEAR